MMTGRWPQTSLLQSTGSMPLVIEEGLATWNNGLQGPQKVLVNLILSQFFSSYICWHFSLLFTSTNWSCCAHIHTHTHDVANEHYAQQTNTIMQTTNRIVCRTGASLVGPQSAVVVVGNRAGVTRAQEKYQYKVSTTHSTRIRFRRHRSELQSGPLHRNMMMMMTDWLAKEEKEASQL